MNALAKNTDFLRKSKTSLPIQEAFTRFGHSKQRTKSNKLLTFFVIVRNPANSTLSSLFRIPAPYCRRLYDKIFFCA
jgi:hypothetical protein